MKYEIFTDGARDEVARLYASSFMIRTSGRYIGMSACTFRGNNIMVAEATAIGLAVEYLLKVCELKPTDEVHIHVDNAGVIKMYDQAKRAGDYSSRNANMVKTWESLCKLSKVCNYKISKIDAHRGFVNGNKIADRLAKYALMTQKEKKG